MEAMKMLVRLIPYKKDTPNCNSIGDIFPLVIRCYKVSASRCFLLVLPFGLPPTANDLSHFSDRRGQGLDPALHPCKQVPGNKDGETQVGD